MVAAWLLLLLDRGATYGYQLRRELDAASVSIDLSVVYRTLRKLEANRLVSSRWARSRHGPRRRSYRITAQGRRELDDAAEVIASIRDVHDTFLHGHAQAVARRRSPAA